MAPAPRPGRAPPATAERALTVGVVTDSTASLPPGLAQGAGVTVVPMWLTLGEVTVRDGELTLEEVVARSAGGFSTSGPTPGEFAAAIEAADEGDGVVVVTLASEMSSTHQAAVLAASLLDDRVVRVVDSRSAAGAQGLVVMAAARRAAQGGDADAVEAAAVEAGRRVRLVATLPNLDHLARGGRVPAAAAWAGRALAVNPLFEFRAGRAHPLRPSLGRAHARDRLVSAFVHDEAGGGRPHVAAMHALDEAAAVALLDAVQAEVHPESAWVGPFSPVMVAHTGPGLVGLAWWWEGRDPDRAARPLDVTG